MKKAIYLAKINIRSAFRDPLFIFWDLIFPAILFILIIVLVSPTPSNSSIKSTVYLLNLDEDLNPILNAIVEESGDFILIDPDSVEDPLAYVVSRSLFDPDPPILIIIWDGFSNGLYRGNAAITAYLPPPDIDPLAEAKVYIFISKLLEHLNYTVEINPLPIDLRFENLILPAIYGIVKEGTLDTAKMFLSIWLMVGGLHASGVLIYIRSIKLDKRLYISPTSKVEIGLWLFFESLIMSAISTVIVYILSMILGIPFSLDIGQLVMLFLIYIMLVFFSVSISLLTIRISARDPLRSYFATLMITLVLLFLSGFSIPLFLFPGSIKEVLILLPTFHIYKATELLLTQGFFGDILYLMIYPFIASVILFSSSIKLMKLGEQD